MILMAKPNLNQKRKKLKEEKRNFDLDFMRINLLLIHQMQFICGNLKRPILTLGSVVSIAYQLWIFELVPIAPKFKLLHLRQNAFKALEKILLIKGTILSGF